MTEFDSFSYAPQDPQPAPQTTNVPAQRLHYNATKRDLSFAGFLLAVCILFMDCLFFAKKGLGFALCFAAFFLILHLYLRKKHRAVTPFSVLCGLSALLGAASFLFSADRLIILLLFLAELLLSALTLRETMALRSGADLFSAVRDLCRILFALTFGRLAFGCRALFWKQEAQGVVKNRAVLSVLYGLGGAIPALCILIPLLASSDAAFEGLLRRVDASTVIECLVAVLTGAGLFLLLFSRMISLEHCTGSSPRTGTFRGLDPVIVGVFLSAVGAAYLLYLFSQLAYVFSAFRGLLPEDFTVAQYARRGFFEMCRIVLLNLCMVLLGARFCRRREDGKLSGMIRALLVFLCLFSAAMVAAALSKMILYVRSFGMTRLRLLTSVFMVFLGIVVVLAALRLFLPRLPLWKLAVTVGTVCLLTVGFVNVDRVVASYNVRAYQTGALDTVDMKTLEDLSDAAVPYLTELLSDPDGRIADQAAAALGERAQTLFDVKKHEDGSAELCERGFDLRAFNLTRERAKRVIRENWAQIQAALPKTRS